MRTVPSDRSIDKRTKLTNRDTVGTFSGSGTPASSCVAPLRYNFLSGGNFIRRERTKLNALRESRYEIIGCRDSPSGIVQHSGSGGVEQFRAGSLYNFAQLGTVSGRGRLIQAVLPISLANGEKNARALNGKLLRYCNSIIAHYTVSDDEQLTNFARGPRLEMLSNADTRYSIFFLVLMLLFLGKKVFPIYRAGTKNLLHY